MRFLLLVLTTAGILACGDMATGDDAYPDAPDAGPLDADSDPSTGGDAGDPTADADAEADSADAPDALADAAPDAQPDADEPLSPAPAWQEVLAWEAFPAHPFRHALGGATQAVARAADRDTIITSGPEGLTIHGADLTVVRRVPLGVEADSVALSADGTLAAATAGDLLLIDLADPEGPVTSAGVPGSLHAVALSPDARRAYAVGGQSLHIFDIEDVRAPTLRGTLDIRGLERITSMQDPDTIVGYGWAGIVMIDVRDPDAPSVLSQQLQAQGSITSVATRGSTLYVSRHREVLVFDAARPTAPRLLGSVTTPNYLAALEPMGAGRLLVVGGQSAHLIDVADPTAPAVVGSWEVLGANGAAPLVDGVRAVVTGPGGLAVIDTRHPGSPAYAGKLDSSDGCVQAADVAVTLRGEAAYVAGESLLVVELDGGRMDVVQAVPGQFQRLDMLSPTRLFATTGGALHAFGYDGPDLTNPVVFDEPSRTPMDVVATRDGRTAFLVTEGGGGLDIVDFSGPAPRLLSHLYVRHTSSVALSNDERTVFVADPYENGLLAIDVRDPENPAVVGRLAVAYGELAVCPNSTTLVATTGAGIHVIDAADITNPTEVGQLVLPGAIDISAGASCERLFAVDQTALHIIDASDLTAPERSATFEVPGLATGVAVSERTALVSATDSGTCLGAVDIGSRVELSEVSRNQPGTRSFTLAWPDRFPDNPEQIAWYTSAGDVVVTDVDQEAGTAHLTWNGAPDDAMLAVAVGNHQYYEIARTR